MLSSLLTEFYYALHEFMGMMTFGSRDLLDWVTHFIRPALFGHAEILLYSNWFRSLQIWTSLAYSEIVHIKTISLAQPPAKPIHIKFILY